MKRTKENWKVPQPDDRNGISGAFTFDGEDLGYRDRKKEYQSTQKNWIEEQKREKALKLQHEKERELEAARQILKANRDRGIAEDCVSSQYRMMKESVRDANLQLIQEKQARERYERELKIKAEQEDLEYQKNIRKKGLY